MFTGLVQEVGTLNKIEGNEEGKRLRVESKTLIEKLDIGASIALDGVCTTVVTLEPPYFDIQASPETLECTTLGTKQSGNPLNLELPLTLNMPLGGHFVTGHVDCVGVVSSIKESGISWIFDFTLPHEKWQGLLIPKGSVAINGISLTVNSILNNEFSVAIIPHTMACTNLGAIQIGERVNIEVDMLGKYVQRLLSVGSEKIALK